MKATVDALVQVALYSAAITAGILLFRFIFKIAYPLSFNTSCGGCLYSG